MFTTDFQWTRAASVCGVSIKIGKISNDRSATYENLYAARDYYHSRLRRLLLN